MDIINYLGDKKLTKGEKLEKESLIIAQKVLCNMGLDFIPHSYAKFLQHFNGIKFEDSYLFGATVDNNLDIVDKNEQMKKPKNTILLGCNDFDLLCYDYKLKKYLIVDRADFEVLNSFDEEEYERALLEILNC